jgi:hypothetical protein
MGMVVPKLKAKSLFIMGATIPFRGKHVKELVIKEFFGEAVHHLSSGG